MVGLLFQVEEGLPLGATQAGTYYEYKWSALLPLRPMHASTGSERQQRTGSSGFAGFAGREEKSGSQAGL